MKKFALEVEDLHVESFAIHNGRFHTGTVRGHEATEESTCAFGCTGAASCWAGDSCWSCDSDNPEQCTNPNTIGVHCGTQGTMNPMVSECVTATMAGPTCEGDTCGQACTYLNCQAGARGKARRLRP